MRSSVSTLCAILFAGTMTLSMAAQTGSAAQAGNDTATTSTKQSAGMGDSDTTFVKKAAEGGLAEVQLGQLAAQKASSPEVKKFGQRMVDDHTKANEQLKQVAAEKNIDLPQQLNAKDKATKARLEKLSGDQFDRAYMKDMVKDHQKDVAEFQKQAQTGKDPAIKNFAQQTLPTLQSHLQEAQQIAPTQQAQTNSAR
jgi:putative membrane protein